jgi:hypothetical protein
MRWTPEQLDEYQARRSEPVLSVKPTRKAKPLSASEHGEQTALIERCKLMEVRYPELKMLIAIPNAGKRSKFAGGMMKAEGLAVGFPDLMLCSVSKIPSRAHYEQYHALFIEMKTATGRVTDAQREWIKHLNSMGYYACVCRGNEEAFRVILWYLGYLDSV